MEALMHLHRLAALWTLMVVSVANPALAEQDDLKSWVSYDVYGGPRILFGNCVAEKEVAGKAEEQIESACGNERSELDFRIYTYNHCLDELFKKHRIPALAYPGYADPELKFVDARAHIAEKLAFDLGFIDEVRANCVPASE
jgi:hypothetical protein